MKAEGGGVAGLLNFVDTDKSECVRIEVAFFKALMGFNGVL